MGKTLIPPGILVVDDSGPVRKHQAARLRDLGTVYECAHGGEALTELDSRTDISVLVTDIQMPTMDGYVLIQETKTRHPRIAYVAVVDPDNADQPIKAAEAGADAIVIERRDLNDLVRVVMGFLPHGWVTHLRDRVLVLILDPRPELCQNLQRLLEMDDDLKIQATFGTNWNELPDPSNNLRLIIVDEAMVDDIERRASAELALLRARLESGRNIPTIVTICQGSQEFADHLTKRYTNVVVLVKPFSNDELIQACKTLLSQK